MPISFYDWSCFDTSLQQILVMGIYLFDVSILLGFCLYSLDYSGNEENYGYAFLGLLLN